MSSIIEFNETLVATATTTAAALILDPKCAYRFVRMECVRTANGGTPAATMQANLSKSSGVANAAASLTTTGHVAQNGAAAAPGTLQRVLANSSADSWFVPDATTPRLYFQPFPDVLGDTFRYIVLLETRPLTRGKIAA